MGKPLVGILMGSDSDFPVMEEASKVLDKFGVGHEVIVSSAHRSPERTRKYVLGASKRGIKILIAGAGGAAHLAGVIAAETTLPVIGVPIKSSNSIDGWDSLLSTVQMPSGIPVATVAINGAKNAGILAAQMIGISNQEISNAVKKFKTDLAQKVEKDNASL